MILSILRHSRTPFWRQLQQFYWRSLLGRRSVAAIAFAVVLDCLKNYVLLSPRWNLVVLSNDLVFMAATAFSFTELVVIGITAQEFDKFRRGGTFEQLHLAGFSASGILSPFFAVLFATFFLSCALPGIAQSFFGYEPVSLILSSMWIYLVSAAMQVYALTALILLLNVYAVSLGYQFLASLVIGFSAYFAVSVLSDSVLVFLTNWVQSSPTSRLIGFLTSGSPSQALGLKIPLTLAWYWAVLICGFCEMLAGVAMVVVLKKSAGRLIARNFHR
ncbi:MAG: hypothetical protein K1X53_08530 [Candidatus Sumerlaeaceae bacterium]|nr:hypothetical protein [Candidatus Sumerlaeaceae bacterium]